MRSRSEAVGREAQTLKLNERSWAIEVISEIVAYGKSHHRKIRSAGGEMSLGAKGRTLFPDVILFGDPEQAVLRQGWELKMPDTPIGDPELLANAEMKARLLRLPSFLVWNVTEAHLYQEVGEGEFLISKIWGPIPISRREEVQERRGDWTGLLACILSDLEVLFETGELRSVSAAALLSDETFQGLLHTTVPYAQGSIREASEVSAQLEAEVRRWTAVQVVKVPATPFEPLARSLMLEWLARFVFAHALRRSRSEADEIALLPETVSIGEAAETFLRLSERVDFAHVLRPSLLAPMIGDEAWSLVAAYNRLLSQSNVGHLDQESLRNALESALGHEKRKAIGQFATPEPLARLLVSMAVENRRGAILDPCCGSGTFAREAVRLKRKKGQTAEEALGTVWASDLMPLPVQLTTIALAEADTIGLPIQTFRRDVLELAPGMAVPLVHPADGSSFELTMPRFDTIVSNLPFIAFEKLTAAFPENESRLTEIQNRHGLDGRSDLSAFLTLHLRSLLAEKGRCGLILSNSWLGTEWGLAFRVALAREFSILGVVASGAGRWFENAEVVTTLLILGARTDPPQRTRFLTTERALPGWSDAYVDAIADAFLTGGASSEGEFSLVEMEPDRLARLENALGSWTALFTDLTWLDPLLPHLRNVGDLLDVSRGERRGWNPMFYRSDAINREKYDRIETPYLRPALRSMKGVTRLRVAPNDLAFSCSLAPDELRARGDTGAAAWIDSFLSAVNEKGRPLPETLVRPNHLWSEMKTTSLAHFAMGMNPEHVLLVSRLEQPAFCDQRSIVLRATREGTDLDLLHALLNSSLSLFFIEASGFGRGLGVLDLNSRKIGRHLSLLNPDCIMPNDRAAILAAFAPLLGREASPLLSEMAEQDRIAFDDAVLRSVGLAQLAPSIRAGLLKMYRIRQAVKS